MTRFRRHVLLLVILAIPLLLLTDRPNLDRPAHTGSWLLAGDAWVRSVEGGWSDGPTVVLLHGYGESLVAWRGIFDQLASRFHVMALDLPGSGESQKPDSGYSLQDMTRRLEDFLDRNTAGPLYLVGHSMGGELAAALALEMPHRIRALVLIAPAGFDLAGALADSPVSATEQTLAGWALTARSHLIPDRAPAWIRDPPEITQRDRSDTAYRRAMESTLREFDFRALRGRLHRLQQPTLLIWGRLDPLIPYSVGREIAGQIQCARLVTLDNAWHRPHVEQPDEVAARVLRFLQAPGRICSPPPIS